MKELNTFLQICIYLTIGLVVFTLCLNFISALEIFGIIETGIAVSGNSPSVFSTITGLNMIAIWGIVTTIAGIGAVVVAILMHSAIPVGAYILSVAFWISYDVCIGVINIPTEAGELLFATAPMSYFLVIITVGMLFIWVAALVGIFTGSG